MLVFSTTINVPLEFLESKGIKQVFMFNLTSYYNSDQIPMLNCIIPSVEHIPEEIIIGDCSTPEFDMNYHNYIMNNDNAFKQFMDLIIPIHQSPEILIVVLIRHTPYSDAITESLMKLIQQRYGYNGYMVNEPEDWFYTEESTFTIPGLFAYDQDILKYQMLCPEIMSCNGDDYD